MIEQADGHERQTAGEYREGQGPAWIDDRGAEYVDAEGDGDRRRCAKVVRAPGPVADGHAQ